MNIRNNPYNFFFRPDIILPSRGETLSRIFFRILLLHLIIPWYSRPILSAIAFCRQEKHLKVRASPSSQIILYSFRCWRSDNAGNSKAADDNELLETILWNVHKISIPQPVSPTLETSLHHYIVFIVYECEW